MANPLFKALGGTLQQNNKRNFAPSLLQHIQGFRGNPVQEVQNKLNSGQMTQDQYNQLHSMAEGIAHKMMSVLPHQ